MQNNFYVVVSLLGYSAAGILGMFTTKDWSDVLFRLEGDTPVEDLRNSVAS